MVHEPVLPAHAGMILSNTKKATNPISAPRSRGDDPYVGASETASVSCSPLTRG